MDTSLAPLLELEKLHDRVLLAAGEQVAPTLQMSISNQDHQFFIQTNPFASQSRFSSPENINADVTGNSICVYRKKKDDVP